MARRRVDSQTPSLFDPPAGKGRPAAAPKPPATARDASAAPMRPANMLTRRPTVTLILFCKEKAVLRRHAAKLAERQVFRVVNVIHCSEDGVVGRGLSAFETGRGNDTTVVLIDFGPKDTPALELARALVEAGLPMHGIVNCYAAEQRWHVFKAGLPHSDMRMQSTGKHRGGRAVILDIIQGVEIPI